jgi:hypothetical protein
MNDAFRTMCICDELELAKNLITTGFGELQEIRMGNDFYHLPHLLLASGLERLIKCYFCLVHEARNGQYPNTRFLKSLGHDLKKLKQTLVADYYSVSNRPLLVQDLDYLKNDPLLDEVIHVLSEFGQKARYYNLDIITGTQKPPIDPKAEWEELEKAIENPSPYIAGDSMDALYRDYYPKVNAQIIAKLERLCRAVTMQFTLGGHGGKLQQVSSIVFDFIKMRDEEFGTIDYRRSAKYFQQSKDKWSKRSKKAVLKSCWPSDVITKEEFRGDWPFRFDEVITECREGLFCIINIEGYDFALNGAAKGRYGYPYPHDAGIAILGKSIGPFIDMAFSLSSKISARRKA